MSYNPLFSLVILMLKLTLDFDKGALRSSLLCHFDLCPAFLNTACTASYSWFIVYFPCPRFESVSLRNLE